MIERKRSGEALDEPGYTTAASLRPVTPSVINAIHEHEIIRSHQLASATATRGGVVYRRVASFTPQIQDNAAYSCCLE